MNATPASPVKNVYYVGKCPSTAQALRCVERGLSGNIVRDSTSPCIREGCQEAFLPLRLSPRCVTVVVQGTSHSLTGAREQASNIPFNDYYVELSTSPQRNWPSCPPLASLQDRENILLCLPSFPANLVLLKPPFSPSVFDLQYILLLISGKIF